MSASLRDGRTTEAERCVTRKRRSLPSSEERCDGCGQLFEGSTILDAMALMWHLHCFRCTVCHIPLPESYYAVAEQPFCKEHFYEKNAHKCQRCSDYITGPTMSVGMSRMFHPECFICSSCGIPLGEKDTYTLLEAGELLCCDCSRMTLVVDQAEPESGKGEGLGMDGSRMAIHLVKIPFIANQKRVKFRLEGTVPTAVGSGSVRMVGGVPGFSTPQLPRPGQKILKRNAALRIEKLPQHLSHSPLKKGDEIIEINGIPIVDQDQKEINSLMFAYHDCLYLTIERKMAAQSLLPKRHKVEHVAMETKTKLPPLHSRPNGRPKPIPAVRQKLLVAKQPPPVAKKPVIANKADPITLRRQFSPRPVSELPLASPTSPRSWRARSIPAFDGKSDYTDCFRLSDLEFGEVIGQGFYGAVSKVRHRFTGQVMVMKEMMRCTEEASRTFYKEVQLLKSLHHPNILQFIGILYRENKRLVLITEYADGGTLRKTIKRKERVFPWFTRISIARDIAAGMSYLHSRKILHRDLTSKNCLLRRDMSAVVADFGLARAFLPHNCCYDDPSDSTKRMTVVGTPYWMAPEMLRGDSYDEKVDVFSFGVVLGEIIARVKADPDELPRLSNFALDVIKFRRMIGDCPLPFYHLATECCTMKPNERPSFLVVQQGLDQLLQLIRTTDVDVGELGENFYALLSPGDMR